ncbi:MAG TPA: class I adenylate-forming enzyme family protein, partial [Microthrixaceae bacterium]|nr:class I adenylate-forming enzyme family protein [Microthrixaceae bacterium]
MTEYKSRGFWRDVTLASVVRAHARDTPDSLAFVSDYGQLTWAGYDSASDEFAKALVASGFEPGDRLAVWMTDSASIHTTFLGAEKAGVVVIGIGARAGDRELAHLIDRSDVRGLATLATHRGSSSTETVSRLREAGVAVGRHLEIPIVELEPNGRITVDSELIDATGIDLAGRTMGPDEVFLINSTSGTTGLPKCVVHYQNRWTYFHQLAARNGELTSDDIFYCAVPAPFGFGIWTSHFTPTLLGARSVIGDSFSSRKALELIERERVTVLCCVSTQFAMMMNDPGWSTADLSSLRIMFTGGEAIPYERAVAFEEQTGCVILQFFGSNETGVLSATSVSDSQERRLRTAGHVVPEMQVRLYDGNRDVT